MADNNTTSNTALENEFVISREVDAPREMVFKMWTEEEHLKNWWGPTGFQLKVAKLDLRPNGVFLYSTENPDGFKMWGKFVYQEIVAPEKILYIISFSDEEGNSKRAPFGTTWPLEVSNTLTLTENAGKTTLTLRSIPINATAEEHATFQAGFDSMKEGFGGTFDKLDDYLTKVK